MKVFTISLCLLVSFSVRAQDSESGINIAKHIAGYTIGYSYPFITRSHGYSLVNADFSFGCKGGFEWGRPYNSGNAFIIAPNFLFTSCGNTTHRSESEEQVNNYLKYRHDRIVKFNYLSLSLPVIFEMPVFKKLRIAAGGNLQFALAGSGRFIMQDYQYYVYYLKEWHELATPRLHEVIYPTEARLASNFGFISRISVPVGKHESAQKFLSIEYLINLTDNNDFGIRENAFILTFTKRNIITKEKREKWDSYLIKKDRIF